MKISMSLRGERRGVIVAVSLWSLSMAVLLPWEILHSTTTLNWVAFSATGFLGLVLGSRGRVAVVFALPVTSWFFAAIPMVCASMAHSGLLKGFFVGLFLITIGYLPISFLQVVTAGVFALLASRFRTRRRVEIIITPPHQPEK